MDKKYFSNGFIIYGVEGGLIFVSKNKEKLIKDIESKILSNKSVIKVDVIATVNRPEKKSKSTYILYIVEVEYNLFF